MYMYSAPFAVSIERQRKENGIAKIWLFFFVVLFQRMKHQRKNCTGFHSVQVGPRLMLHKHNLRKVIHLSICKQVLSLCTEIRFS